MLIVVAAILVIAAVVYVFVKWHNEKRVTEQTVAPEVAQVDKHPLLSINNHDV